MELGPEDMSLLERCPHFRGCCVWELSIYDCMISQELKTGMNESSVFSVFHPDAMDLFTVCSSLEKACGEYCTLFSRLMLVSVPNFLINDSLCKEHFTMHSIYTLAIHFTFKESTTSL